MDRQGWKVSGAHTVPNYEMSYAKIGCLYPSISVLCSLHTEIRHGGNRY